MKTFNVKNYTTQLYRRYSLRKNTPPILKTMYIDRKGSLVDLRQNFGEEEVQKNIYLGNLITLSNDTYLTTKNGIDTIKVFYKKQNPFQLITSVLFGILSKPFG